MLAGQPGSVDRGQEAAGGAVERESSVLPGRALTQSRESLHVAPDRTGIRLVLFRERVRLGGVLLRHVMPLHDRFDDGFTSRTELLGRRPQDRGAFAKRLKNARLGRDMTAKTMAWKTGFRDRQLPQDRTRGEQSKAQNSVNGRRESGAISLTSMRHNLGCLYQPSTRGSGRRGGVHSSCRARAELLPKIARRDRWQRLRRWAPRAPH